MASKCYTLLIQFTKLASKISFFFFSLSVANQYLINTFWILKLTPVVSTSIKASSYLFLYIKKRFKISCFLGLVVRNFVSSWKAHITVGFFSFRIKGNFICLKWAYQDFFAINIMIKGRCGLNTMNVFIYWQVTVRHWNRLKPHCLEHNYL